MFTLEGKNALITGGGSGLGQAIAHGLSDAGASIVIVGRTKKKLQESLGSRKGFYYDCDITLQQSLMELYQFCDDRQTMPDIIVNAAGVNHRQKAKEVTLESWNHTIHLNLSTPFFIVQRFIEHMKQKKWGRVINIASLQTSRALPSGIAYGSSKAGIAQLTRAMAEEWSAYGINANAIAPGYFPTELTKPVFDDKERANFLAEQTAIGRNGMLDDMKGPAVFFASEASKYVTGQVLYVDGGFTAK